MKRWNTIQRSRGILAMIAAGVTIFSVTMISCDGNSSPSSPLRSNGGKNPGVMTDSPLQTVSVNRSGIEGTALTSSQLDPVIEVGNFEGGGVSSTMSEPVNVWRQAVTGSWSGEGNGGLRLSSVSDGEQTSTLDFQESNAADGGVTFTPNFTGAASNGTFTLVLYNGGDEVTRFEDLDVGTSIPVRPPQDACCQWPGAWYFGVPVVDGSCVWQVTLARCCGWTVTYNGEQWEVDRIDFVEGIVPGQYAYHTFDQIDILPLEDHTAPASLSITSEFAVVY